MLLNIFRCARDLVRGDISCLLALAEWDEPSSNVGDDTTYVQKVLEKEKGKRRIFGNYPNYIIVYEFSRRGFDGTVS